MGVYQRYTKKNKDGDNIIGKNGKPVKEGAWFVQYLESMSKEVECVSGR